MLNGALLALLPLMAFSRALRNSTWFISSGIVVLLEVGREQNQLRILCPKLYTLYKICQPSDCLLCPQLSRQTPIFGAISIYRLHWRILYTILRLPGMALVHRGENGSASHDYRSALGLSRRCDGRSAHDGTARQ